MADDLRIYRRQAAAAPPPVADVESDSESEDELDGPDTPSPTQTTFPTGISTSAPASTQTSTADLGNIGTDTLVVSSTTTSETTTNGAALSATSPTQNSQAQQSDVSQSTDQSGLMSRGGVIAMGLLIGLATVATIAFVVWKCRRRRNRSKSGAASKFKPFFLGRDRPPQSEEVRAPSRAMRAQSRTMDDLMAAAYAAENGTGSVWGGRPASQESSDTLWREKQGLGAYAPQQQQQQQQRQKSTSGSLYANQLLTGFWKKGGDDAGMPAAPGQARVPAPAPSVAGKTEMTSQSGATESTWNTWGVMQHHSKPKANWIEKLRR